MKTSKFNEWPHRAAIGSWPTVLLIVIGMQILVLRQSLAATTKKEITDRGMASAVEDGLRLEKGVLPYDVDVTTGRGSSLFPARWETFSPKNGR